MSETVYIIKDESELHEHTLKLLLECGYDFGGYIDINMGKFDTRNKILGDVSDLIQASKKYDYRVVLAIKNNTKRKELAKVLKRYENIKFITLIHPNTPIRLHAKISKGCIIFDGGVVSHQSKIGKFSILGGGVVIGMDVRVEKYCTIGWGAVIGNSAVVLKENYIEPHTYINPNSVYEYN